MTEYVTATNNTRETLDVLKRILADSNYYGMYAQLSIATYYKAINLDAAALRVLIAHYSMPERDPRPAWLDPEPSDTPAPVLRPPEEMRE